MIIELLIAAAAMGAAYGVSRSRSSRDGSKSARIVDDEYGRTESEYSRLSYFADVFMHIEERGVMIRLRGAFLDSVVSAVDEWPGGPQDAIREAFSSLDGELVPGARKQMWTTYLERKEYLDSIE